MLNHPTWAEVDLNALARNLREIRKVTSGAAEMMAVVKANGYGHGAVETARAALDNGASQLAVARVAEGASLRRAGIDAPVLVLGYTPPGMFAELIEHSLIQTVFSREYAALLSREACRRGVKAPVHIKVDTGMGRLGLVTGGPGTLHETMEIAGLSHLEVEGLYTHFAAADSADKKYTRIQFDFFMEFLSQVRRQGLEVRYRHCANSAAIIDHPETHLDLVRPGIVLYGLYPSEEVDRTKINLYPAMSFKTRVAMVKRVSAGFKISYGCTYVTPGPTTIATLPVGYADGYPRALSSRGEVLIHGRRAPVVGRVCMDQCMVDVGHITGVAPGDEVVLFGTQAGAVLPVEEVASKMDTINYEVVCMVSARVPRVYHSGS